MHPSYGQGQKKSSRFARWRQRIACWFISGWTNGLRVWYDEDEKGQLSTRGLEAFFCFGKERSRMTVFERVYEAVKQIPEGSVASYGQVAEAIGNRRLSRVVGYALHVNPQPGVIPCHRVVGADGSLTGYAGGLFRKTFLLELENGC